MMSKFSLLAIVLLCLSTPTIAMVGKTWLDIKQENKTAKEIGIVLEDSDPIEATPTQKETQTSK